MQPEYVDYDGEEEDDDQEPLEAGIPPKPKRPLTAFNLFGKLERNYIVQTSLKQSHAPIPALSETTTTEPSESSDASATLVDPYLEIRPEKYRDIVMPPDWFKVGKNVIRRQDYQTHGVIKFEKLSKVVVERWKALDEETKNFLQTIYATELAGYRKEVAAYIEKYGQAAMDAQKATYKKRKGNDDTTAIATSNVSSTSANNRVANQISHHPNTYSTHIHHEAVIDSIPRDHHNSQSFAMASDQTTTAAAQMNQLRNAYFASLQTNAYPSNITFQGNALHNAAAPVVGQPPNRSHSGVMHSFDNTHTRDLNSQTQSHPPPQNQMALPHAGAQTQNSNSSISSNCSPAAWSQPNQMPRMIGLDRSRSENATMNTIESSAMAFQDAIASGLEMNVPFHNMNMSTNNQSSCSIQGGAFQSTMSTDLPKIPPNDNAMFSNYYNSESQYGQSHSQPDIDYQSIIMEQYMQQRGERTPHPEQPVDATGSLQITDTGQTLKEQEDNSIGSVSVSTAAQHSLWPPQGQVHPHFQQHRMVAQHLQNQMTGSNSRTALYPTMRDSSISVPPETSQLQRQPHAFNHPDQAQGADATRHNETGAKKDYDGRYSSSSRHR